MFYLGINMVPASLGAIIIGSGPLFIAMIAHLLINDDRLSGKKLMIFLLGVIGIVIVSAGRNNFSLSGEIKLTGIFYFASLCSVELDSIVSTDKKHASFVTRFHQCNRGSMFIFIIVNSGRINITVKALYYIFSCLVELAFWSAVFQSGSIILKKAE